MPRQGVYGPLGSDGRYARPIPTEKSVIWVVPNWHRSRKRATSGVSSLWFWDEGAENCPPIPVKTVSRVTPIEGLHDWAGSSSRFSVLDEPRRRGSMNSKSLEL